MSPTTIPPSGGFFYVFIAAEFSGRRKICPEKSAFIDGNSFPDERTQSAAVKNSS